MYKFLHLFLTAIDWLFTNEFSSLTQLMVTHTRDTYALYVCNEQHIKLSIMKCTSLYISSIRWYQYQHINWNYLWLTWHCKQSNNNLLGRRVTFSYLLILWSAFYSPYHSNTHIFGCLSLNLWLIVLPIWVSKVSLELTACYTLTRAIVPFFSSPFPKKNKGFFVRMAFRGGKVMKVGVLNHAHYLAVLNCPWKAVLLTFSTPWENIVCEHSGDRNRESVHCHFLL